MGICMMCGQEVEAGDKAHHEEETPAHLRGWKIAWSYALDSSDPQMVADAKKAISIIDEKLARLGLAFYFPAPKRARRSKQTSR